MIDRQEGFKGVCFDAITIGPSLLHSKSLCKYANRDIARKHTKPAIATLVRVMKDKNASASAQVAAATALLDRAHGRPQQQILLNTPESISDTLREISERPQAEQVAELASPLKLAS